MISRAIKSFLTTILLMFSLSGYAHAAMSLPVKTEQTEVKLISSDAHHAGIYFKLSPGWRIYWRTPGDAGMPPSFDWHNSQNIAQKSINVLWPAPKRVVDTASGIQDFVYLDEVVLPVEFALNDTNGASILTLALNYVACKEICVPFSANLSLTTLPTEHDPVSAALIDRFRNHVPVPRHDITIIDHRLIGAGGKTFLDIGVKAEEPLIQADVFVEGPDGFRFLTPDVRLEDDRLSGHFRIPVIPPSPNDSLLGKPLHVTVVNHETDATDAEFTASAAFTPEAPLPSSVNRYSLLVILGFALLGGLILNIMPCVLPILSLKLFGILKHGGSKSPHLRLHLISSALGIITSFLIIAASLIILQSLGRSVGFGFQFQQPLFIIALVLILVIFACNLMGVFEIALSSRLADFAMARTSGTAGELATHFLSGAFATLLATPCSAPFLGTAVSFALLHSPLTILLIFAVMGVGMALPYLLLALFPVCIRILPKPGEWMETVRYLLGIAMLSTALWLIYVLAGQLGVIPAVMLFFMCLLIKFFLEQQRGILGKSGVKMTAIFLTIALAFYIPPTQSKNDKKIETAEEQEQKELWKPFEQDKIAGLVEQGHIVFVDVTADWCLTCKINKFSTLDRSGVMKLLKSPQITAMRADITSPDPIVSAYLRSFERYGIPFNVVYGPKAPKGIPLPVLINKDDIMQAMHAAGLEDGGK